MSSIKKVLRAITPYGLVELRRRHLHRQTPESVMTGREHFHETRHARIAAAMATAPSSSALMDGRDRDAVLAFLSARGIPPHHINEGSVPAASLAFMGEHLTRYLSSDRPLISLHVGNFLGVSLAYLAATLKQLHPDSLVLAVDPNLTHRGVVNPQEHVAALLCACNLQRNTMLIAGYSSTKSISNDGVNFGGYDPAAAFSAENACEMTLSNLSRIMKAGCDVVMMDGNHEAQYLSQEIATVRPLMRSGSLLVLDDVDSYWSEIQRVFADLAQHRLHPVGADGRIGIAQAE